MQVGVTLDDVTYGNLDFWLSQNFGIDLDDKELLAMIILSRGRVYRGLLKGASVDFVSKADFDAAARRLLEIYTLEC